MPLVELLGMRLISDIKIKQMPQRHITIINPSMQTRTWTFGSQMSIYSAGRPLDFCSLLSLCTCVNAATGRFHLFQYCIDHQIVLLYVYYLLAHLSTDDPSILRKEIRPM